MRRHPRPLTRSEKACLLPLVVLVGVAAWMGAIGCTVAPPQEFRQPDFPVLFTSEQELTQLNPGASYATVWRTIGSGKGDPEGKTQGYRAPQPLLVSRSRVGDAWIEAYEIEIERAKGRPEKVWLYLCANRLIRWGPPFNWPSKAEVDKGLQQASEPAP